MLKRFDVNIVSMPLCSKLVNNLQAEDFKYYDKDGFELNRAEQLYYRAMGYPIDSGILNHSCWQEPWFELEDKHTELILDHCIILTRCSYTGEALYQLERLSSSIPEAQWIIDTPKKWGYDFALDAVNPEGKIYEVLHVEYDNKDYENFKNNMISFEYLVRHTDWHDAAKQIWLKRDEWQHLKSFAQNDWKAKFLLGWKKAEYTEKSLT